MKRPPPEPGYSRRRLRAHFDQFGSWYLWLLIISALALLLYLYGTQLWALLQQPDELQRFLQQLGWRGPAALILLTILQIILAPIPGYGVYLVAGWIYGPWWGGVWGSIGLLLGGTAAMWVGRHFGRPLVIRLIGAATLARWEKLTRSDKTIVWFGILLSPIGDAPFLLAGLTGIAYKKILILTIVTRVPAAFAAAALGAGAMHLNGWQLTAIIVLLAIPYALLTYYQEQITQLFYRWVKRLHLSRH